uniref:Uncharacterized protein n=1 Tax=viral metagenome TaxID=1070528 RepID=A0A6C0H9G2_9ZZZZ
MKKCNTFLIIDFFKLKYYLKIFIIIFEYNKLLNK